MRNVSLNTVQASWVGDVAVGVLAIDQPFSLLGNTSKGIFLETSSRWLVFLSYERFRSPLTVTLAESSGSLPEVKPKLRGEIVSGKLDFRDTSLVIATENSQVWHTACPKGPALPKPARLIKLTRCAEIVLGEKRGGGLSPILVDLLKYPVAKTLGESTESLPLFDVSAIQGSIANQDPVSFAQAVASLLGAGQGLTPSGDDFLTGLLLALNRWEEALWPRDNLKETNRQVVESAYHKTTRLSANLIELATLGKGDERLISVVDLLMSIPRIERGVVLDLLSWGGSSGVDAFVGMAVALSA